MRRAIGWIERNPQGGRREVKVNIAAGVVKWQFWNEELGDWERPSEAPRECWETLERKLLDLKQRGHLFDREIELVRRHLAGL